jgi:hypothetical protein
VPARYYAWITAIGELRVKPMYTGPLARSIPDRTTLRSMAMAAATNAPGARSTRPSNHHQLRGKFMRRMSWSVLLLQWSTSRSLARWSKSLSALTAGTMAGAATTNAAPQTATRCGLMTTALAPSTALPLDGKERVIGMTLKRQSARQTSLQVFNKKLTSPSQR